MKLKTSISDLWRAANEITAEIELWLRVRENKALRLRFRSGDQARLLRLRVWSARYCLSVGEILDIIIGPLRWMTHSQQKRYGLGVSIASLVGDGAERILKRELEKLYPDNEHRIAWRDRLRNLQLEAEAKDSLEGLAPHTTSAISLLESKSLTAYVQQYSTRVISARQKYNNTIHQAWRTRRHYRGNPWL